MANTNAPLPTLQIVGTAHLRPGAVDDGDGLRHGGLDVEVGGIEDQGVGGGFERGDRPVLVALVAPQDVGEHWRKIVAAPRK